MGAWKNEQKATELLTGNVVFPQTSYRGFSFALAALTILIAVTAAVLLLRHRAQGSPTGQVEAAIVPASAVAPVEASPPAVPSPAVNSRAAIAAAQPEMIILPPVVLGEKAPAHARASGAPPARPPAAFVAARQVAPATPLANAYAALHAGKPSAALDFLKAAASGGADPKETAVLEGRALLAAGQFEAARQEFEPLARTATPDTELGANALFGDLWCRAGTLSRCPESELDPIRNGADSWGASMAALEEARRAEEAAASDPSALEKARRLYQQALDNGKLEEKEEAQCLARLTELTNKLVLDPKAPCSAPAAVFHQVEPGDGVEKLARKYKVNQGQIKRLNHLDDKLVIRYGQTLKILPGPVLYRVNRTRLNGTLYIDGVFIHRYPVGVGPADATPLGLFTIERKVTNPDWYCDGKRIPFGNPDNILGSRWMTLATTDGTARAEGLGIHGTTRPETVPGRESKGCVRMLNSDVEELYDLIPQGGKVEIAD